MKGGLRSKKIIFEQLLPVSLCQTATSTCISLLSYALGPFLHYLPSILALSLVHIVESDYSGEGWQE